MEKRVSLRVLFYIKRTKLWEDGRAPIYAKLTINRTYAEMALNRAVKPSLWDANKVSASSRTGATRIRQHENAS